MEADTWHCSRQANVILTAMPDLTMAQWLLAGGAALLVGFAKTGVPGIGILVVPLMAAAFGARPSVGLLLPILITADCLAVAAYRRHAQWQHLWGLVPWVAVGMVQGFLVLYLVDEPGWFSPLIGGIVLLMLLVALGRQRWGAHFKPRHRLTVAAAGAATGAATTIANAAGPIMTVYLAGKGMAKEAFMGTNAWFFLLLNISKVPLFVLVAWLPGGKPLFTVESLQIDLLLAPLVIPGAYLGRWLLPKLRTDWFYGLVLVLAGLAALRLLFS